MPKFKTCKSVSKRVKVTRNGKVVRYKQGKSHLLSGKSAKRRRHMRLRSNLTGPLAERVKLAVL